METQTLPKRQEYTAPEWDHTFDYRVVVEKEEEYLRLRRIKALIEAAESKKPGDPASPVDMETLNKLYRGQWKKIELVACLSRKKEQRSRLAQRIKVLDLRSPPQSLPIWQIAESPLYQNMHAKFIRTFVEPSFRDLYQQKSEIDAEVNRLTGELDALATAEKQILENKVLQAELNRPPVGLAFSGGGIRSATFNLGLVQSLSRFGILPWVDYLSSISGGGLTAACMTSLLGRCAAFNTQWSSFPFNPGLKAFLPPDGEHQNAADPSSTRPVPKETMSDHNVQLAHLRNKGNYLIPRKGWIDRDTLRTVGAVLVGMVHTIGTFLLALLVLAAAHYAIIALLSPAILGDIELPAPQASAKAKAGEVIYHPRGDEKRDEIVDGGADEEPIALLEPVSTESAKFKYEYPIADLLFRDYGPPVQEQQGRRDVRWQPYLWSVGLGLLCSALGFWLIVYLYCAYQKIHSFEPLRALSRFLYRWFENRMETDARVTIALEKKVKCVECVSWLTETTGIELDKIAVLSPRDSARRITLRMPEADALQLKLMYYGGELKSSAAIRPTKLKVRLGSEDARLGLTSQEGIDKRILLLTSALYLAILSVSVIWLRVAYHSRASGPQIFWIWLPALFAFGNQLGLSLLRSWPFAVSYRSKAGKPLSKRGAWSRPRFRTIYWAWYSLGTYFTVALVVLAVLSLPHFFLIQRASGKAIPYATVMISATWAAFLSYTGGKNDSGGNALGKLFTLSPALRNALLCALVIVLNLSVFFVFQAGIDRFVQTDAFGFVQDLFFGMAHWVAIGIGIGAPGLAVLLVWLIAPFINLNYITPHYWYRDRIADAYLKTEIPSPGKGIQLVRDHSTLRLHQINPLDKSFPYHLIVTAVNLPGSWQLAYKDRKAKPFILSRYYCGSDPTGYVKTERYRDGWTKYSRALALSAAAVSSSVGFQTFFAQAFITTLLNVRLGLWMTNPREHDRAWKRFVCAAGKRGRWRKVLHRHMQRIRDARVFWPSYLKDEALGASNERRHMVNLSDGGHTGDNAALYPLFQRRCKIIIAGDASQDPEGTCADLFRVIRQVKVDLNVDVEIDVDGLRPAQYDKDTKIGQPSQYHCAVGTITYPAIYDAQDNQVKAQQKGWLIYFKPAITDAVPDVVKQYWETHPAQFPHPTTADQFFDEEQFESQRHLGEFTVQHTLERLQLHYQAVLDQAVKTAGGERKKTTKARRRLRLVKAILDERAGAVLEAILENPSKAKAMIEDLQQATTVPPQ